MQTIHQWSDLQKGNILENNDDQPKLSYLLDNVEKINSITFKVGNQKVPGQNQEKYIMVGLCDKKVREQRGMIFQDKSFVGHGTYLLYSTHSNSFLFSHWDLEANYNEGGFVFEDEDIIQVSYHEQQQMLEVKNVNNPQKTVSLKIEHHQKENLHFCVVILKGKLEQLG